MTSGLIIEEVFGAGGDAGSPYAADFVVIHNVTNAAIDLTGFALQFGKPQQTTWVAGALSGTISAFGYYLVQMGPSSTANGGAVLPATDAAFTAASFTLGPNAGKLAITNSATVLSGANPSTNASVIDFVGYGQGINSTLPANGYEGTGPAAEPSATLSIHRDISNGWDTNNSVADWVTGAPTPRNHTTAAFDASPQFQSAATASIAETTTAALDVNAFDPDTIPSATTVVNGTMVADIGMTYSIVAPGSGGGADGSLFQINTATGALSFASAPNFEAGAGSGNDSNHYLVTVRATDSTGATSDQAITITVTDVNEAPTAFTASNVQPVAENAAVQTVVADLTLTDPDTNPAFNTYTYSVSDGRFDVVGGQLVLKAGQTVNFETEPSISLTVTATNTANPSHAITTDPITVTITDVNEAPTAFTASNVQPVAENAAVQTVVADLTLTDPDTNPAFNTYTYSVSDGRFDVVGGQLVLKAGQTVNFETEPSISLTVTATNTANPSHAITTDPITVTITDVNEAPTAVALNNALSNILYNTDTSANYKVADIAVSDDAITAGNVMSLSGADAPLFTIIGNSLYLKSGTTLLTGNTFHVTVEAADPSVAGSPPVTFAYSLPVTGNDPPTAINLSADHVAENNPANAPIGTLSAADPNSNDTFTYSLITGVGETNDNAAFTISGDELHINAAANFEAKPSYSVHLQVTDSANNTFDVTKMIMVDNVNEAPTSFTASNVQALAENSATQTIAAALTLVDPDTSAAFNMYIYTVSDNRFDVVGGNLVLKAGQAVNFETEPSISLTVTATNTNNTSHVITTAPITINVTNVNEAPTVTSGTTATIMENMPAATIVYTATASDPDAGDNVTWSLAGTDAAKLSIDALTGAVHLNASADFETKASYNFNVVATDVGALTGTKAVTLSIVNVSPEILKGTLSNDVLVGGSDIDHIYGLAGNDQIYGGAGSDLITGGIGRDVITGGAGKDVFDFNAIGETGKSATTRDVILDYVHGADRLDLSTIDANTKLSGNQAFTYIGAQAFHHVTGELHCVQQAAAAGVPARTIVEGDVNGNGTADFQIELRGLITLSSKDFIL